MTPVETLPLWLLLAVVATMPVFALVSRNRPRDADVARRSASALLGFWIRDWLMWVLGPAERALVRAGVSPDVFNYLGVAFGAAAGVLFAERALALAGWAILFGGLADVFDGRIAGNDGEFAATVADHWVAQARGDVHRLRDAGPLLAQPAEVGGVRRVAAHLQDLLPVGRREDSAPHAAVRAQRLHLAAHQYTSRA